ncbi:MAG: tRNA (adenosine(37)-N6)-dimethylallyltransferase, partial [Betaproteobacteria bacterium]
GLHAELARVDPATAARLAPTDSQRIQRALEVYALTGTPISSLQGSRAAGALPGPTLVIALMPQDRARLHRIIAERFDAMLARGLVDEVRGLRARYALHPRLPSMRCVGYRQVLECLESGSGLRELRERGIAATRQLARRQLTWLRGMDLSMIDCYADDVAETAAARVAQALEAESH